MYIVDQKFQTLLFLFLFSTDAVLKVSDMLNDIK